MKRYAQMIVKLMKSENLYASQGGPIILSQIENEYGMVARAFKQKGKSYVKWAAKLAVELETGVPWVMCKQDESHDPLINACNGRQCGETIPSFSETTIRSEYLLEHMNTTQDTSDYLWQIFR